MSGNLFILGAGGHGRAVAEIATLSGTWNRVCFLDDTFPASQRSGTWSIVGKLNDVDRLVRSEEDEIFIAIGNQDIRKRLTIVYRRQQIKFANIVHPRAWVSDSARLASGVAIMAGAVVGYAASVGHGVIINANAVVDHDVMLGDFSHLGVGVNLAGGVVIGDSAWLQAGSSAGYDVVVDAGKITSPGTALIRTE